MQHNTQLLWHDWEKNSLGKVRPDQIKKAAREILTRYHERFTTNFEENKKILNQVARVYSPRMKNRITGYITRLMVISQRALAEEAEKAEEEVTISEETQ
jgi:small subunit ribosomal protein S17e